MDNNTFVVSNRKQVYLATDVPEDVARFAQVAIVTRETWHLLGPRRAHGVLSYAALPAVTCPIVDISQLPESKDYEVGTVLRSYLGASGVLEAEQLIFELEMLGAIVTRPDQQMDQK